MVLGAIGLSHKEQESNPTGNPCGFEINFLEHRLSIFHNDVHLT
jgi:hypothetical protein